MISQATVETLHGASYLKRLCRHFAHKVPVALEGEQARIELPFAHCNIEVGDNQMLLRLDIADADDTARAEQVIADHLVRMANKDEPEVRWTRSDR